MIGSHPQPILVVRHTRWDLFTAALFGFLVGVAFALGFYAQGVAFAGGPAVVTWDQAVDCQSVTAWELLAAPITTANPNPQPTAATVGVTIPNSGPPCGLAMTRTVNLSGVGPVRYWLRAVAGSLRSGESNSVDASLPLGKPSGLTVALP